jgi:ABC-type transport system involved in cytochrome bd biosynthesis fused ATPase/permease subunit
VLAAIGCGFLTESLQGLETIRAFRGGAHAEAHIGNLVDRSTRCQAAQLFASRWLGVRLEMFGAAVTGVVAVSLVTALRGDRGGNRVIQVSVSRARVPEQASTRRERSER